jgi:hypothetical protein
MHKAALRAMLFGTLVASVLLCICASRQCIYISVHVPLSLCFPFALQVAAQASTATKLLVVRLLWQGWQHVSGNAHSSRRGASLHEVCTYLQAFCSTAITVSAMHPVSVAVGVSY